MDIWLTFKRFINEAEKKMIPCCNLYTDDASVFIHMEPQVPLGVGKILFGKEYFE